MSRIRKILIAVSVSLVLAIGCLVAYLLWLSQNHYYLPDSVYSPHELVARLRAGELEPGTRDRPWRAKEREWYRCGGYPRSDCRVYRCSAGEETWYEFSYPEYRFEYVRYEDREATYSLYAEHGALFAAYEWSKTSRTGRFHFNDEATLQAYLQTLEVEAQHREPPWTYAVPEPLRDSYPGERTGRGDTVRTLVSGEEAERAARAAGLDVRPR